MTIPATKPEKVDAVIIGAGASGAAAAKVLTEGGMRVVALEKGPWRTRSPSAGTSWRTSTVTTCGPIRCEPAHLAARHRERSGGRPLLPGSADGRRWDGPLAGVAPTVHREPLPSAQHRRSSWRGPHPPTADHVCRAGAVLHQVEWAFGVSGQAGANSSSPSVRGYPCPPMPQSRYAEKFHLGVWATRWNCSRLRRRHCRSPSTDGPRLVISDLREATRRSSGTRSSA